MRILFTLIALLSANANAAVCSRTLTFVDGAVLTASQLNAEFNAITNCANTLDNANITVSANIRPIKLDPSIVDPTGALFRDSITGSLSVNADGVSLIEDSNVLKVGPLGIDVSMLAANSVSTAKIVDAAVTTDKIADANVTRAKLEIETARSLVPPGTILPYGGALAPDGYLLCNGTAYARADYPDLFAVISTFYGTSSPTLFNVPDLRGRFIRGADSGTGRDPDASSRTAMATGGNIGDSVGSIQSDQYKSHSHTVALSTNVSIQAIFGAGGNVGLTQSALPIQLTAGSGSSGGNETRPINANITYIIKY